MSGLARPDGLPLARSLRRAFGAFLLVVLVVGFTGMSALAEGYGHYRHTTEESFPLQQANERALITMVNAETAVRGYALSGAPEYLSLWRDSAPDFAAEMAVLREISKHDPELHARLVPIIEKQEWRAARWQQFAAVRVQDRAGLNLLGDTPAKARETSLAGKSLFDGFRAANAEVEAVLAEHRVAADNQARGRYRTVIVIIPIVMVTGLLMAVILGVSVARQTTMPLHHLDAVLRRMRGGELGARADVQGPLEVQTVAGAINDLALAGEELARIRNEGAQRDAVVRRISAAVREHLDLNVVLDRSVEQLGAAFDASRVRLVILSGGGSGEVAGKADWSDGTANVDPGYVAGPAVHQAFESVLSGGGIVSVDDIVGFLPFAGPHAGALRSELVKLGTAAFMAAPVTIDGEAAGVVAVMSKTPRRWSAHDHAVLDAAIGEIGRAVGHARLYQAQKELVAKLGELDRTRSDFVSSVSHELRTPLASIMGYSEMLIDGAAGGLPEQQLSMVEVIDRNGRRLLALIEDLLTLSRVEAGEVDVHPVPADVGMLVEDAVSAFGATLGKRSISVDVDVDAATCMAMADVTQIERVLTNLLSNAVKFSPDGSTVEVRLKSDRGRLVVSVRDYGMGIPVEEQHGLFTRFFRSTLARSNAIQGTGLGLAIVKGIVEGHGGSVHLESAAGQGTTVTFDLALAGAPVTADA